MRGISWLAEILLASQAGLGSMKWVSNKEDHERNLSQNTLWICNSKSRRAAMQVSAWAKSPRYLNMPLNKLGTDSAVTSGRKDSMHVLE